MSLVLVGSGDYRGLDAVTFAQLESPLALERDLSAKGLAELKVGVVVLFHLGQGDEAQVLLGCPIDAEKVSSAKIEKRRMGIDEKAKDLIARAEELARTPLIVLASGRDRNCLRHVRGRVGLDPFELDVLGVVGLRAGQVSVLREELEPGFCDCLEADVGLDLGDRAKVLKQPVARLGQQGITGIRAVRGSVIDIVVLER